MALWKRLRRKRDQARTSLTFDCDIRLAENLKRLAERDGKPAGELAAALLRQGLAARRVDLAEAAWEKLTAREKEVVALHQLGYSRAEIARLLNITHSTVSTHVRRILARLQLETPADLLELFENWDFSEWEGE